MSIISQEQIMELLNACYQKATEGMPNSKTIPPIEDFAEDYLKRNQDPRAAAKSMIKFQVAKCTTSGFITGFGGLITLPVAIPANITSVIYIQMRMIACTAYLAGWDPHSDQVQTLAYACVAGVAVNDLVKNAGIKVGEKFAAVMINRIPGKALAAINKKVGFRLLTKFGQKGIVNLGKLLPGVGAAISGGFDFVETANIGQRAYKMFFDGDFSGGEDLDSTSMDIVDLDYENIDDGSIHK